MIKLKKLLKEWNDTSFKDLSKRWSKPAMKGRETDGLTEFERMGGIDVEMGKVYTDRDRPPFKTEFIDSIGARLGYKISLAIESGDVIASPAVMQEQEVEEQLNQDKSSLLENPVLKDILDSFDGKIIDESINKVSS